MGTYHLEQGLFGIINLVIHIECNNLKNKNVIKP